jgi:hypothetical protein
VPTTKKLLELTDTSVDWEDYSEMKQLTCAKHQDARYLTKNPWNRTLHLIDPPKGLKPEEYSNTGECKCPFSDLRVVVEVVEELSDATTVSGVALPRKADMSIFSSEVDE